jgi:hypothetical protein
MAGAKGDLPVAEIVQALGEVGAEAAAAVMTGAEIVPAVAVPLAGKFTELIANLLHSRSRRRMNAFAIGYLEGASGVDQELVEAQLHARSEDPAVQELVLESARALAEALADSVVPVMARLTRLYITNERPADGFFRGVRRLLTDLTEPEFRDFRAVLEITAAALSEPVSTDLIELRVEPPAAAGGRPQLQLIYVTTDYGSRTMSDGRTIGFAPDAAVRIFQLLRTHTLGHPGAGPTGAALPTSVLLERAVVRRLWETIR